MARLSGNLDFTGSIGNLSAFKRKGTDGTLLRSKGGASKDKIMHDPSFANTRKNNDEFGGAASAGKALRNAFGRVGHISGGSVGYINKFTRALANMDMVNELGRRAVHFSETRQYLEGFNLNKYLLLNSILRQQVTGTVSRDSGSASLVIPALVPGINFKIPPAYQLYCFVPMLAVLPDFTHKSTIKPFYRPVQPVTYHTEEGTSGWFAAKEHVPEQHFNLQLKNFTGLHDSHSLLLCLGIEFGRPLSSQLVETIRQSGAVQILAAG